MRGGNEVACACRANAILYEARCCIVDIILFPSFYGFEQQGLATADLVHGNREESMRSVADRMFILPKQSRSLRSGIIICYNNSNNNNNNNLYSSIFEYVY